jgi:hypothetical protein
MVILKIKKLNKNKEVNKDGEKDKRAISSIDWHGSST